MQTRRRGAHHGVEGLAHDLRQVRKSARFEALGLGAQPVELIERHIGKKVAGTLRSGNENDQIPEALEQILHETSRFVA